MKKLWLIGIVMILAMAALSCDSAWGPVGDADSGSEASAAVPESFQANVTASGKFTADGRPMMDLAIPTGGSSSRALTDALAKAATDYYEVIFYDGTNYYRTAGYKGETLRLSVPSGLYDDATSAIMLAGTKRDMTLLASGIITRVDANVATPLNIDVNTTSVTFTLASLTTDVKAAATSSFGITTNGITTATDSNFYVVQDTNGNSYPFFKIKGNDPTGNIALFEIDGLTATGTGIMIKDIDPPLISVGETRFGANPVEILGNVKIPAANTAIGVAGLELEFDTTGITSGFTRITIDVPVVGINASATGSGGFVWHVRGGLDNNALDMGIPSTGGSILLAIENPLGFVVIPPTPVP